ncbi:MAG: hypothetical protein ABGZ17_03145, partial [Planctomycetaceae bacterium]
MPLQGTIPQDLGSGGKDESQPCAGDARVGTDAQGDWEDKHAVCRDLAPIPSVVRHPIRCLMWLIATAFGLANLIVLLAVVAAIPIVNLYALGYLLDVEGRLARTGRLRRGFPLVALAARLGSMVIGCWIWIMPIRLLAILAADAEIIDAGGTSSIRFQILTAGVAVVVALHLCLAVARGGRLSCFFRPFRNILWLKSEFKTGAYLTRADRHVRDVMAAFRFRYHIWLGFRGFIGSLVWLVPPTILFAAAERTQGGQILVSIIGGVLLAVVLCHLPFLQAQFAAENRLRAMFDWRAARLRFRQAPLAFLSALILLYSLATPLYLAKVRLPPQDAMWLLTVV